MYSIAIVGNGWVYGVILVDDSGLVQRAWIDPELVPGRYEKMVFRHPDPKEVMRKTNDVLAVRPIPEVDIKEWVFGNLRDGDATIQLERGLSGNYLD